ncbi:hypothetical protein EYZ11_001833 [Aspergillus tanneri]|uniref:Uncharacterized protein n=1 Tax=Aspergillus tanneri TaxID=1220188 RepID=A0A4S3JSA7_9EURO|nr:hypothetical protein EYZ11_001833 [Aspergillus tanneri]
MPSLAVSISSAGGLGFLAAEYDVSNLQRNLEEAVQLGSVSSTGVPILSNPWPPSGYTDHGLVLWSQDSAREPETLGRLRAGDEFRKEHQGLDPGGHGLARSASIVALIPEVYDALRERQKSVVTILAGRNRQWARNSRCSGPGTIGAVLGARFLSSIEANIARGYQDEILRVSDGGVDTVHSIVYDRVRGIKYWPSRYDGRGVVTRN